MSPPTAADLSSSSEQKPRRRYRVSRSTSRRRERRQDVPPAPTPTPEEVDSDPDGISSGDEDGVLSDSDFEDDETPVPASGQPPAPTTTSVSAITTFRVDRGGLIVSALPVDDPNPDLPLNVGLPGPVETTSSEETTSSSSSSSRSSRSSSSSTSTDSVTATTTDPATTTTSLPSLTTSSWTTVTTPSATLVDKAFNNDDDDHPELEKHLQATKETNQHIMIGGGSIGAFVGVCVLGWLAWRMTRARRKARRNRSSSSDSAPSSGEGGDGRTLSRQGRLGMVLGKIPWIKDRPWVQKWQTLDDEDNFPAREKFPDDRSSAWLSEYYGPDADEKGAGVAGSARAVSLRKVIVPPIDTGFNFTTVSPSQNVGTFLSNVTTAVPSAAVVAAHQHQQSFGSLEGQGGTWVYVSPTGPSQYGQNLGLQPPQPPQPPQAHRASALTSLSSGFGDGDIVIPAAYQRAAGVRDTMYTATSEDQPPRFRPINSWVDQQKGRIQRAQQRAENGTLVSGGGADEGVPPVPGIPAGTGQNGIPPEPQLNMMMPDGEVPRRVDSR